MIRRHIRWDETGKKVYVELTQEEEILEGVIERPTLVDIKREASRRMLELVKEYSEEEVKTFPIQSQRAQEFINNPATKNTQLLENLASPRGITVEEMALIIVTKAAIFEDKVSKILACQLVLESMDEIPLDFKDNIWWT